MKKLILCLGFVLCLVNFAYAGDKYKGVVITKDGQKHEVEEFLDIGRNFHFKHKGADTSVPVSVLAEIVVSEITDRRYGRGDFIVVNKEGKEFAVQATLGNFFDEEYEMVIKTYNEISGSFAKAEISYSKIDRIIFSKDHGKFKVNPETGKLYPSDYRFDPFDKTPLVFGE